MSVGRRRETIEPQHPKRAIVEQGASIGISRSAYFAPLKGESPPNLSLMRLPMRGSGQQFRDTPWYGSRQMARYRRRLGHLVGREVGRRLMASTRSGRVFCAIRPSTSRTGSRHGLLALSLAGIG